MRSQPPRLRVRTPVQIADYQPGSSYGPRILPDYELVWLLRGSARWTTQVLDGEGSVVDQQVHQLRPGMVALARQGTREEYSWDRDRLSQHAYVHFTVEATSRLGPVETWPVVRPMSEVGLIEPLCGYLLDLAAVPSDWARLRSDEMVELLVDLFAGGPLQHETEPVPDRLQRVADRVWDRWSQDGMIIIPVAELAEAANLSLGHLHQVFRDSYGCGPSRALELIRLASAAVSLQRSNDTLRQIAAVTGYSNPYHFSRRFAATYGMPPGQYRLTGEYADPLAPVRRFRLLGLATCLLRHGPGGEP